MGKYSRYSDKELVRLLKDKSESEAAFGEIYDRYSSTIYAYILKIVNNRDQTDDLFQETFIRFYENANPDHKNLHIQRFLITIARNLCLNFKRNKKSTIPIEEFDYLLTVNQKQEEKELMDLINIGLELLEQEYKEPLVLRVYNGLSYEEIAEICGLSAGNARIRVFRAKDKLKAILDPYINDLSKKV